MAVLAAPRRREILRLAWDAPRSAGELHRDLSALQPITFGAVSQHLRVLVEAGLVDVRSEGRQRHYSVRKQELAPFIPWLKASWDDALYRLKLLAELERSRRGPLAQSARRNKRRPRSGKR